MTTNPESLVIGYLTDNGVSNVFAEIPNPSFDNMVIVETTGGDYKNGAQLASVSLAIQVYSPTRLQASTLALSIHEKLTQLADNVSNIASSNVGVPYNFTTDTPRYQMTLDIKIKE